MTRDSIHNTTFFYCTILYCIYIYFETKVRHTSAKAHEIVDHLTKLCQLERRFHSRESIIHLFTFLFRSNFSCCYLKVEVLEVPNLPGEINLSPQLPIILSLSLSLSLTKAWVSLSLSLSRRLTKDFMRAQVSTKFIFTIFSHSVPGIF